MKKIFSFVAIAVFTVMSMTSCLNSDDVTSKDVYIVGFEESYFSDLVDSPQYNGPLIYSADEYTWTDTETQLTSTVVKDDWSAWGYGYGWNSGFAVSNYVDDSSDANFDKQLAVPETDGSKNFIVCYGDDSEISFADGKARVIEGFYISPTTYLLNNIKANYGTGYYFNVVMTITESTGSTTTLRLCMAEDTNVISGWNFVDLSSYGIGAIKKLSFSFEGSDNSDYGLNTPKYIAIDNVIIDK